MIYLNSRPVNRKSKPVNVNRRFEWRGFVDDDQETLDVLRDRFDYQYNEKRSDHFFLLPGRRDRIAKIANNETFEIKTLIDEEGPLELWETTVKSKVPLQRTLAQTIAKLIPKFSGPVVGSMTTEELSESLSKKSRFYRVERDREVFQRGDVRARLSKIHTGDETRLSLALEGTKAAAIQNELKSLKLSKKGNMHLGAYLLDNVMPE